MQDSALIVNIHKMSDSTRYILELQDPVVAKKNLALQDPAAGRTSESPDPAVAVKTLAQLDQAAVAYTLAVVFYILESPDPAVAT